MVRFTLLSAVSTHNDPPEKASRPFDKTRAGFVIAEGAAALVLEDYDQRYRARGGNSWRGARLWRARRYLPSHPLHARRFSDDWGDGQYA